MLKVLLSKFYILIRIQQVTLLRIQGPTNTGSCHDTQITWFVFQGCLKLQEANTCTETCGDRWGSRLSWSLLPSLPGTRMKTLEEKGKQERLSGNQANTKCSHPNFLASFHTSVVGLKGLMFWSIYFSPDLSRVFLCTCFISFSFSTHTFEPVGIF